MSHFNEMVESPEAIKTVDEPFRHSKIIDIRQAGRLAMEYHKAGKDLKAKRICDIMLHAAPENAEALHLLGRIAMCDSDYRKAVNLIERAVKSDSNRDSFYCDLGLAYKAIGRFNDAVTAFESAIEINPKNTHAFYNKGLTHKAQGTSGRAAEAFQRVVNIDPESPSARHLLAALTGETTEKAPKQYIIDLFDQYSKNFDQHLTQILGYQLPGRIHRELKAFGRIQKFKRVIDLGCGTGLVGKEIRWAADKLIGVDMSPKMVTLAGRKKIYDMIFEYEMVDFLFQTEIQYNLFVAADVLIYTGNLKPLFEAIQRRSADGAYFILTTEHTEAKDIQLLRTGRYAHSPGYIAALADEYGYTVKGSRSINIRRERGKWIVGDLFVLKL